jgi:hypothetical protein
MRIATMPTAFLMTCLSMALASPCWARIPGSHRTTSTTSHSKRSALPMNPVAFWQGVARASTAYQKEMARAFKRYSFMRKIGGPANAQLTNDTYSAFLGANSKFWQTAAKSTPWGAMVKASAAPFYGPFGSLRVPTPVQYWSSVMRELRPSSPPSSPPSSSGATTPSRSGN